MNLQTIDYVLIYSASFIWGAYCGFAQKGMLATIVGIAAFTFVYMAARSFL